MTAQSTKLVAISMFDFVSVIPPLALVVVEAVVEVVAAIDPAFV